MHREKGSRYEQAAERHLNARGLRTIGRNFNCKLGEIDLIMDDGEYLVFVEVRYRNSNAFGSPLESITASKQHRISRAAATFLQREQQLALRPCRFDAVGITGPDDSLVFDWIKGAFPA